MTTKKLKTKNNQLQTYRLMSKGSFCRRALIFGDEHAILFSKEVSCLKKFEGILFCTDLDGTLYDDNKVISKQNLDAIEYFKSEGGRFTFISGRVPLTAKAIRDLVKPNAPYGCSNGGGVYDGTNDKYLWNVFLHPDMIELIRAVDELLPEIGIQYNMPDVVYFNKDNEAMVEFRRVTGLPNVYRHYEEIPDPVLKVVFAHHKEEQILALSRLLHEHPKAHNFAFIRSEKTLFEMLPKGINKGMALVKIAELLGIDRKNTIAVGDYNNDIAMVEAAGVGFAVANAVDEVKAVADHVTVSNNEHAIAAIVEGLDKGEFLPRCGFHN